MLNYIKKYVSTTLNTEVYEIGFQGGCYSFTLGDGLNSYLDYMEKKINEEIRTNESQISAARVGNEGKKSILSTPVIAHYTRANKKLAGEIELINSLRRHLESLDNGTVLEDDEFADEKGPKGVTLKDRIRMELGGRPSNIKQLEVYRGILERKIGKLQDRKQGSKDRRSLAYPLYTMSVVPDTPLKGDAEEIDFVYTTRLQELENDAIECSQVVSEESDRLSKEWEKVEDAYRTILDILAYEGYSELEADPETGLVAPETERRDIRYRLRKALVGRDYRDASDYYDEAYDQLAEADESLANYRANEARNKRKIAREILEYNKQLAYEASLDARIADLREKGTAYVRKFK